MKIFRKLSFALIISVSLNIALIGYLCFIKLDDFRVSLPQVLKPASLKSHSLSNQSIYANLRQLTTEQLLEYLKDKSPIEDGLKTRDIALGILVKEHAFDIQRGLGKTPSFRMIYLGAASFPLYSKLTDPQFSSLYDFGKKESWPLTAKGMFELLKGSTVPKISLQQAFMLTTPFQNLERLFPNVPKETLLKLSLEGSWNTLENIPAMLANRQQVLLNYIDESSPTAASLLLEHETYFAFKRLEDEQVVKVLQLSSEKSALSAKFVLSVLASPRSEEIKALAMKKLKTFSNKATLLDDLVAKKTEEEKVKRYIVQQGDNLWKIAKKSNVSLNELLKANHLAENAVLQPGESLVIP